MIILFFLKGSFDAAWPSLVLGIVTLIKIRGGFNLDAGKYLIQGFESTGFSETVIVCRNKETNLVPCYGYEEVKL